MNQLDIDPTELRGIGIQINKLESRTVRNGGCIKNFISNMKLEYNQNQNSSNQDASNNIAESNTHQRSSIINIPKTKSTSTGNSNKSKSVVDFFKPKEGTSNSKKQTITTLSISNNNDSHQPTLTNLRMSQIDPSFLDAMPADLRREIENELNANEPQNYVPTEQENLETMEVTMTEESSRLYNCVHVDQMKEFIEEWVTTEHEPKTCDNIMVSEYLCNLVKDSKTENAYEIIRKLYR